MNKTSKKIFSICCAVVTTLTATLFYSTNLRAGDQKYKIVFAGPSQAGKSNLVSRICENSYKSDYKATEGMDFVKASPLEIWDTSGDRRFLGLIDGCFQFARLCVLSISDTTQETEDFLKVIAKKMFKT